MDSSHTALCTTLRDGLGWPAEVAAEVSQYAHIVPYEKDATVFHAGESTDLLYVLLAGEVRLYYGTVAGERLLVSIIRSGQLFGDTDFQATDASPRHDEQLFTAQTLSRSKIAVIARTRVARLLHDLPGADLVRVIQSVDSKWVGLCGRLLTFMTQDVRSRLAQAIGEITKNFGIPDARGKLIALRLSHEDFAELIGASRPMVSKHLKELAQCGIFVKESGRYVILREEALARIASGKPATLASKDDQPLRRAVRPTLSPMPERSIAGVRAGARRERETVGKEVPKRLVQRQLAAVAS
jgi:CRP/FNR family cyclic AMP-dependent transcriptional regulator